MEAGSGGQWVGTLSTIWESLVEIPLSFQANSLSIILVAVGTMAIGENNIRRAPATNSLTFTVGGMV